MSSTVLTLHQGDAQREFTEHPLATARDALRAAADLEDDAWAGILRRMADALPDRSNRPVTRSHPVPLEVARSALLSAAEREAPYMARALRHVAESLPLRGA